MGGDTGGWRGKWPGGWNIMWGTGWVNGRGDRWNVEKEVAREGHRWMKGCVDRYKSMAAYVI